MYNFRYLFNSLFYLFPTIYVLETNFTEMLQNIIDNGQVVNNGCGGGIPNINLAHGSTLKYVLSNRIGYITLVSLFLKPNTAYPDYIPFKTPNKHEKRQSS